MVITHMNLHPYSWVFLSLDFLFTHNPLLSPTNNNHNVQFITISR